MRIATWNVNSLNARLPRVEEWIDYARPDVLCMQETKLADAAFPSMAFSALGYESASHGDGRWNGVAIVSRVGLDDVVRGFGGPADDQGARLVAATCGGVRVHSVYVPNGREVGERALRGQAGVVRRAARLPGAHGQADRRRGGVRGLQRRPRGPRRLGPGRPGGGDARDRPRARSALQDLEEWGLVDAFRLVLRRGPALHVVGLPGRQLPQAHGPADRPRHGEPAPGRRGHLRPRRPQRPQGQAALRPRPGARRHRR